MKKINLDVRFDGVISVDEELFEKNAINAIREAIKNKDYTVETSGYVIQGEYHRYEGTDESFYVEYEVDF